MSDRWTDEFPGIVLTPTRTDGPGNPLPTEEQVREVRDHLDWQASRRHSFRDSLAKARHAIARADMNGTL